MRSTSTMFILQLLPAGPTGYPDSYVGLGLSREVFDLCAITMSTSSDDIYHLER